MDTKDYVRNKVASVAIGRCVVAKLPLAFAALCAQDAALPGRIGHGYAALLGCTGAQLSTSPRCAAPTPPSSPAQLPPPMPPWAQGLAARTEGASPCA